MYINTNYNNSISFNARLGANLKLKLLNNEFGGNVKRLEKFEKLFRETSAKTLDTNTIIDINKSGRFIMSNSVAPKIIYPVKIMDKNKSLAHRIINECDKLYFTTEYRLFQRIISRGVRSGKSLDKVSKLAEKFDDNRRPYFTDLIGTAERILKENPKSKLTETDFMVMINTQIREIVETPEFQQAMAEGNFSGAVKILKG